MGFNYKPDNYIPFHQRYPDQFFFATETASTISSRGEYFFPVVGPGFGMVNAPRRPRRGEHPTTAPLTTAPANPPVPQNNKTRQVSSYDLYYPTWASSVDHEFYGQDHSPAVGGEFVWTGFDYIGEPTPWGDGPNPSRSSYFGIFDLCGFPKDRFYLYQAHWRPDYPMAHILPHWNWPERAADPTANPPKPGMITPVHVYTSGDEAELFLNGKSLGRKKKIFEGTNQLMNGKPIEGQPAYRIRWDDVVYEPGELKVVAYKNGKEWATDTVKTTGPAAQLLLQPDRSTIAGDGHDISYVKLIVADKDGLMVPRSKNLIHFTISGPGVIVVTDNGDPTDLNIFSNPDRLAFNGLALAVVKAKHGETGTITLTAKSDGLTTGTTEIQIK
jgi:beta-galactosidase